LFLVSAVLASLALPTLPTIARAADDCLTGPNKATPAGGHWRYHLERGTGRKCWYLGDEAAKADVDKADSEDSGVTNSTPPTPAMKVMPSLERAAASPPDKPRATKPAPAPAAQAPASNARAEYIDSQGNAQPPASTVPAQPVPVQPPAAAPDAADAQGSVATRWPSPGSMGPADNNSAPAATAALAASSQPPVEPQTAPAAADQAVAAAPAEQAAATQPADTSEGPDYLLYALIASVTGFTLVVGFAGLRFLVDWWRDWRDEQRWRQSQPSYADMRGGSMLTLGDVPMGLAPAGDAAIPQIRPQRAFAEEEPPRRLEDEIDHIEQLLALTRQAGTQPHASSWDAPTQRDAAE